MTKEIKVLDHGYVKMVGVLGNDNTILEFARMSTDNPTGVDIVKDDRLREYLWKNHHMSPFEAPTIQFEIKCPIFVARQLMRYRTFSFNEYSQRYSEAIEEYYVPDMENINKQSKSNKQIGNEPLSDSVRVEFIEDIIETQKYSIDKYKKSLNNGVAREMSRIMQPVSNYTKFRMSGNLRNWFNLLQQRLDSTHAQHETCITAQAIAQIISELFPKTYSIFQDYTLNSITLSGSEKQVLCDLIDRLTNCKMVDINEQELKLIQKLEG